MSSSSRTQLNLFNLSDESQRLILRQEGDKSTITSTTLLEFSIPTLKIISGLNTIENVVDTIISNETGLIDEINQRSTQIANLNILLESESITRELNDNQIIETFQSDITELRRNLNRETTRLNDELVKIDDLETSVVDLELQINNQIHTNVSNINDELSAITSNVSAVSSDINLNISNIINTNLVQSAEVSAEIQDLRIRLLRSSFNNTDGNTGGNTGGNVNVDFSQIENQIAEISKDFDLEIARIKLDKQFINSEISENNSDISELFNANISLTNVINNVNIEITELSNIIENIDNSSNSGLQSQIDTLQMENTSMQTQITELHNIISSLTDENC